MNIEFTIITVRKRSLGQGNIFRSVCQEFCPHGGSTWAGTPPRPGTIPGRGTPPEQCMLGDTGNKRAVPIILECIPVISIYVFSLLHKVGRFDIFVLLCSEEQNKFSKTFNSYDDWTSNLFHPMCLSYTVGIKHEAPGLWHFTSLCILMLLQLS